MAVSQYDFVNVESGTDETYVPLDQEPETYDAAGAIDEINGVIVNGTLETKIDYLADTKDDIREAIIDKGVAVAETDPFRSYAEKIGDIACGEINNQNITVTENGVYEAESGYTGLGEVTVEVPDPTLETATITRNGTYTPTAYGFSEVTVEVDTVNNQNKTVTENGTYTPDTGYTGLGQVVVEVPESTFETATFTENGTYTPTADGYSEVTVEVPEPVLAPLSVTENGNYEPSGDGYSSVSVNVQPNLENKTIKVNGTYRAGSGYDGFGTVEVEVDDTPAVVEPLSITPTTSQQVITPTTGVDGFSTVTVAAVDSNIDPNILSNNIVQGATILGISGSAVELNGETTTVTPSTSQQVITPTSPHNGLTEVTVSAVDSTIDSNITAGNIKSGVSILGVNGSVVELNADSLSVTPTTSAQLIQPTSPYNAFDEVSVAAVTAAIDPNILAGNIKSGVSILGVAGSVVEVNNQNKTVNQNGTYTADAGYTGLGEVTVSVSAPVLSGVNVAATTSQQTLTPPSGTDGWNKIIVSAVTSAIDGNIIPSNIKDGETILGVTGNLVPLRAATGAANPDTTSATYTPSSPYNAFSSFTVNAVTAAIDSNIVAGNIKSGVSILGVNGSCVELNAESTTVSPTTSATTVYPTSPYNALSSVTVEAVNSSIDSNIVAGNIKEGVTILGVLGTYNAGAVHYIQRNIDANGKLVATGSMTTLDFTGVTDVASYCMRNAYYYNTTITGTALRNASSLVAVSGDYAFSEAWRGCSGITRTGLNNLVTVSGSSAFSGAFDSSGVVYADLDDLEVVSGQYAFNNTFNVCQNLVSTGLHSLRTVSARGAFQGTFGTCQALTDVGLENLESVTGQGAFSSCFYQCDSIQTVTMNKLKVITEQLNTTSGGYGMFASKAMTDLYLGGLESSTFATRTDQLQYLFGSRTGVSSGGCTLHFPSNFDPSDPNHTFDASTLVGYPTFGGQAAYINLAYDLPATS